jgi:hypothetical protein
MPADDAAVALPQANAVSQAKAPAAQAAAVNGAGAGLATPAQIIELADQLSACADQIQERIMRDIRAYGGAPVPEKVQDSLRTLQEDAMLLRQRANGLHTDAASLIVKGLGKSQATLVKLTVDAAEKIRKIGLIGEVTGVVGGLLALAGAVATGQPLPVLAAIDKIQKHTKAAKALQPKKPVVKT